MHTRRKQTLRFIAQTRSRFASLMAIVTIGSAFFIGVSFSSTLMADSVDAWMDRTKFRDLTLYSSYGFDDDDVANVAAAKDVETAVGGKWVDVSASSGSDQMITRVHAYDPDAVMDQLELVEGRMPQADNEAVAEVSSADHKSFAIGSEVTLTRPENDLDDFLSVDTVTIVGTVRTPLYLNTAKEESTLSSQDLETFLYVPSSAFTMDYDTEIAVLSKDGASYDAFSDAYYDYSRTLKDEITAIQLADGTHRRQQIVADAEQDYNEGLQEYEDGKKNFDDEIAEAKQKLADSQQEINDGWKEINDNIQKLEDAQATLDQSEIDGYQQIYDARAKISYGRRQLEEGQKQLDEQKETAEAGISRLNTLKDSLTQASSFLSSLETMIARLSVLHQQETLSEADQQELQMYQAALQAPVSDPAVLLNYAQGAYAAAQTQIYQQLSVNSDSLSQAGISFPSDGSALTSSSLTSMAAAAETKAASIQQQLDDAQQTIDENSAELDKAYELTVNGAVELEQKIADGQQEINDGWAEINEAKQKLIDGQKELDEGKQELEDQKADGQKELDDSWQKLQDARQKIDDLKEEKWTILDRTSMYGPESYRQSVKQMASIASIFPLFFVMVAALVCMTTMTRMVDENRGQLGILRALGYTPLQCMSTYLWYAGSAGILGTLLGAVVGSLTFPIIIYTAWGMMYNLPSAVSEIPVNYIAIAMIVFPLTLLVTTAWVAHQDLKEKPASLMRPKSPKMGRRMLLEKWKVLWKRLSFSSKITLRNLVRYKQRFFFTVVGVAGCTALLVTGFGIRSSISTMSTVQYGELTHYDAALTMDSSYWLADEERTVTDSGLSEWIVETGMERLEVKHSDDSETMAVYVFFSPSDQAKAMTLRTRSSHEDVALSSEGIEISEKEAENLNVSIGDTVEIVKDDVSYNAVIAGIYESYLQQGIVMSSDAYRAIFETDADANSLLIRAQEGKTDDLRTLISDGSNIDSVSYTADNVAKYAHMVNSLGYIVGVIILCSMALAFVVIGNLTSINIAERQREIATLKVLGFRGKEVQQYIFQENNILTAVGAVCGLPIGVWLHHWIMRQVEMDSVMFGRTIPAVDLVASLLLTCLFGIVVDFFMRRRLQEIQMVESLKSIE